MPKKSLTSKEMAESVRLSVNIPWDHYQDLQYISEARGIYLSTLVRNLIHEFLIGDPNVGQSSTDNSKSSSRIHPSSLKKPLTGMD